MIATKTIPPKIYTLEEYLSREEKSLHKHQFFKGQIIRMAGAKSNHNLIATNVSFAIKLATRKLSEKFLIYNSDQKIYFPNLEIAVYPDALVICEKPLFWKNREDLIINPLVVVEVLSESTKSYDRGDKFTLYKLAPSLKEYILIEQHKAYIESWYRLEGNIWENTFEENLENTFPLRSLGIEIALSDVYEHIEF